MATIGEFSDAPKYTIKTVSARAGIAAVTLRAWERRYGLVKPRRTRGNYRLYSERDLALLRWLKARVDGGAPIGAAAAEMRSARRAGHWPEAPEAPHAAKTAAPDAGPPARHAQRLFAALRGHNEAAAGHTLDDALDAHDLTTVCLEVIAPCLEEIGNGWERGNIRVSTEHFASTYLRGRLMALLHSFPIQRTSPLILIGCAEGEHHEIGSLMLALFLRRDGYRVEFLGPDLPTEDLLAYAREQRPGLICLGAGADESAREVARLHAGLKSLRPRPKLGFGGRIFNLKPALREAVPGEFLGESVGEASRRVTDLLPLWSE